jgi:hypothetical protein
MQPAFFSNAQPLWLRLLHKAMLPNARRSYGWLSDTGHWSRRPGRYCVDLCRFCSAQRHIDAAPLRPTRRKTGVL